MQYLFWFVAYVLTCAGGRQLLRLIRSDRDAMIHLRASQRTTLAAILISGFVTASLLGVALWGTLHGDGLPIVWKTVTAVGTGTTLLLLLIHYTESDIVQSAVFFIVAFLLFAALSAVF